MKRIVYFQDKSLIFSTEQVCEGAFPLPVDDPSVLQRAKILFFLESHNTLHYCTADPDASFARFAEEFTIIEAAGGVVMNPQGDCLMIQRNERWDLPKGHLEKGESIAACAVREIAEETGVSGEVVRPLCDTWHAYFFPLTERWELKQTHWYLLRATGQMPTIPQAEEGIVAAEWCDRTTVAAHLAESYPTIRTVFHALEA